MLLKSHAQCAGAIVNSRIEFLYFGCYDEDYGACGSKFEICGNVSLNTPAVVRGNLLAGESLALLQEYFFKKDRRKRILNNKWKDCFSVFWIRPKLTMIPFMSLNSSWNEICHGPNHK